MATGCSRVSIQQYEILLEFMEKHPELVRGKLTNEFTVKQRRTLWDEVTKLLNCSGCGPVKDNEKWRKTWNDWKSQTRGKAATIKSYYNKTGGGAVCKIKLNDLEERLLNLIGWVTVEGSDVPEGGLCAIDPEGSSAKQTTIVNVRTGEQPYQDESSETEEYEDESEYSRDDDTA